MKNNTHGSSRHCAGVSSACVLSVAVLASGGAALADGNSTTFVSGNSTYSDCGVEGSDLAIALTGDLEGCWSVFVEGFDCKELHGYDLYLENGREVFEGTLRGDEGGFTTEYTLEAAMATGFCESFDFSLEVAGGCSHEIRGRSGVFKGANGLIKFLDVITGVTGDPVTGEFNAGTGPNNFPYYGDIQTAQKD